MLRLVFILVCLAQLTYGFPTNSTSSSHAWSADDKESLRTIWSILGNCAITSLICVWHAIHFDISYSGYLVCKGPVGLVLCSIVAPEVVVSASSQEWWEPRRKVIELHKEGYEWSITHSFFAEMGGFVYRDTDDNPRTVKSLEFLELCKANKIANPVISVAEIKDRSKSDALGKAILAIQLVWFTGQVVARGSRGLAITLIELDTVVMAALTLSVLWFWWEKPLRPHCLHIFYSPQDIRVDPRMRSVLRNAWGPEPSCLYKLRSRFNCTQRARSIAGEEGTALVGKDETSEVRSVSDSLVAKTNRGDVTGISLCATWLLLGGLHLIAWDFDFPTAMERMMWRVASLVLAGGSLLFFGAHATVRDYPQVWRLVARSALFSGVASRTLLVVLVFASLRSLPPSAFQTISWMAYIPHL